MALPGEQLGGANLQRDLRVIGNNFRGIIGVVGGLNSQRSRVLEYEGVHDELEDLLAARQTDAIDGLLAEPDISPVDKLAGTLEVLAAGEGRDGQTAANLRELNGLDNGKPFVVIGMAEDGVTKSIVYGVTAGSHPNRPGQLAIRPLTNPLRREASDRRPHAPFSILSSQVTHFDAAPAGVKAHKEALSGWSISLPVGVDLSELVIARSVRQVDEALSGVAADAKAEDLPAMVAYGEAAVTAVMQEHFAASDPETRAHLLAYGLNHGIHPELIARSVPVAEISEAREQLGKLFDRVLAQYTFNQIGRRAVAQAVINGKHDPVYETAEASEWRVNRGTLDQPPQLASLRVKDFLQRSDQDILRAVNNGTINAKAMLHNHPELELDAIDRIKPVAIHFANGITVGVNIAREVYGARDLGQSPDAHKYGEELQVALLEQTLERNDGLPREQRLRCSKRRQIERKLDETKGKPAVLVGKLISILSDPRTITRVNFG